MVFVAAVVAMSLSACNKGSSSSSSNNSSGVSTDGQTVTFSSTSQNNLTLAGSNLNVIIRNIQGWGYGQVRFDLSINNSSSGMFAYTNQWSQYQQMGQIYVSSNAYCTDSSCNTTYLTVLLSAQTSGQVCSYMGCQQAYEYRQLAVKRVNGSIPSNGIRTWNLGTNVNQALSAQALSQVF